VLKVGLLKYRSGLLHGHKIKKKIMTNFTAGDLSQLEAPTTFLNFFAVQKEKEGKEEAEPLRVITIIISSAEQNFSFNLSVSLISLLSIKHDIQKFSERLLTLSLLNRASS